MAYICQNKRFLDTGGKAMWVGMEEKKVLKNRTWGSMKERFRKVGRIRFLVQTIIDNIKLCTEIIIIG